MVYPAWIDCLVVKSLRGKGKDRERERETALFIRHLDVCQDESGWVFSMHQTSSRSQRRVISFENQAHVFRQARRLTDALR